MIVPLHTDSRALVDRSLDGDQAAFGRLIERESIRLRMVIAKSIGDVARADFDEEDMYQAAVAEAWAALPQFEYRGTRSFFAWLCTIVRHRIVDRARYVRTRQRPVPRGDAHVVGDDREPLDPRTSVMSSAARRHDYEVVRNALDRLEPEQRRLIELYYLDELTIREIATQEGMARATAFDRLERAIGRLRREIDANVSGFSR